MQRTYHLTQIVYKITFGQRNSNLKLFCGNVNIKIDRADRLAGKLNANINNYILFCMSVITL